MAAENEKRKARRKSVWRSKLNRISRINLKKVFQAKPHKPQEGSRHAADDQNKPEMNTALDQKLDVLFEKGKKLIPTKQLGRLSVFFAAGEQRAEDVMARIVTKIDGLLDRAAVNASAKTEKLCVLLVLAEIRGERVKAYIEGHKRKTAVCVCGLMAVAIGSAVFVSSMTSYEYLYNGKLLGTVKNQGDVYKIVDIIGDKLSHEHDAKISINKDEDITFQKVYGFHVALDSQEKILENFTYLQDMKARGYAIYVDGQQKVILDNKTDADMVLSKIKNQYVNNDGSIQYESIDFTEKVEVKEIDTKVGKLQPEDKALEYMLTGASAQKVHVVQAGQTFSEIASIYEMKQSQLRASNPDVVPEKLQIAQELVLTQSVPVVNVKTNEKATYNMPIPYEVAYENTDKMYQGETTVKSMGQSGYKEITAEITRQNGVEVSRKELSSKVLSNPVSQVVLVGTSEKPITVATGKFDYPVRGRLSSRFGSRWGRLHAGIDLAVPKGTNIAASDGGTVTFAGYNGALGYCVKIDHGGGVTTVYGHNSKLLVKSGEKVYKGQAIAKAGSTGRSTGSHCHFEIRINGDAQNPLDYL